MELKTTEDFKILINSEKGNRFSNGFVYNLYLNFNKNSAKTATQLLEWSRAKSNLISVKTKIVRLDKEIRGLKDKINYKWDQIAHYMHQQFLFPEPRQALKNIQIKQPAMVSPLKTRSDRECHSCHTQKMCNVDLLRVNKKLKLSYNAEKKENLNTKKKFQFKKINKVILRYQLKLKDLQAKNLSITRSLKKSHLKCTHLLKKIKTLENKISQWHMKEAHLENSIIDTMEDECVESFVETKKNKKQFNYVTRYVIYRCLEYNVPVKAIAKVILVCSKIYSRNTSDIDLPVISTVAQMSREMGVIADLQVAEAVLQADGVTLSFDATTIKGNHINEIHFNTKEQSLTASVLMLPGGRAEDYVQHIMDTLEDLSITYSAFHKCEIQEVRNKMRGKILSTLTDRAAVNSATVNKLNDLLERQLLQLNCHLHPLDGIANETRKVLLESNSIIPSAVHGTDCRIANLLYAISKLRYRNTGDPAGFKSFLMKNGLSCGTFPRYVGNRWHILFHSAGIIFQHRLFLIKYFEKICTRTALSTAILADLKNEHLIHQLQALGLWSKLVTGPWMALFYAAEGQRNHFDMVKHIKKALNFIQKVLDSPEVLYRSEMDAFDFPLLNNETLKSLLLINSTKYLNETIKVVAQATLNVLNRQYFRYLHGDLSDPSIQTKHMAASAPLHNVWAERTLGFYNLLYQKSPNAEMTFLDGKTKAKVNKALDWVSIKTIDEQEKILNFCLSRGAAARKLGKSRRKRNGEVIMHRLEESGQKRDTGKRKKLAKDIKDALQDSSVPILQTKHFTALSDQQKLRITDMLNENQLNILGSNIDHLWNLNGVDVLYRGKIVSRSKQFEESITFTISYWKYDEDAEDYTLPLIDLLCDIILGDLTFS